MRKIPIEYATPKFQAEFKRSSNGRVPPIFRNTPGSIPSGSTILIGDRTKEYGNGLASTGYVMLNGKPLGSVAVEHAEVTRGWIWAP